MSTRATATCDCGWTGGPYRSEKQAAYALRRHSCDKHRAQVAYAALAADREAERERLIDRTPQPCHHKQADHQHGTYVTYTQDRCRCWPCTNASRTYNNQLRRRNLYGRSNLVPSQPVRDHVHALMAAGIGLKTIGRHTGINGGVMAKLMYGTKENGHRPSRKIAKHNAEAILALDPTDTTLLADGARTDPTGTARRLQALVWRGWSINRLAAASGLDRQRLDGALHGRAITLATARTISGLYDRLWDEEPPQGNRGEKVAYSRARRYAQERGWVGPLAWDDDTIDDPDARPDTGHDEPTKGGPRVRLHVEDVEWLLDQEDHTWHGIAHRLGVRRDTVERALHRAGRRDLIERLTINTRGTVAA